MKSKSPAREGQRNEGGGGADRSPGGRRASVSSPSTRKAKKEGGGHFNRTYMRGFLDFSKHTRVKKERG